LKHETLQKLIIIKYNAIYYVT